MKPMHAAFWLCFLAFAWRGFAQEAKNDAIPAPKPFVLFAEYGDLDQQYDDTPGSQDRRSSYAWNRVTGPDYDTEMSDTDNPLAPKTRLYPFALQGYEAFDPRTVTFGTLRFDVLYQPGNEVNYIQFFDEDGVRSGFVQFSIGLELLMEAKAQKREQWLALVIDCCSGEMTAQEIDAFGNPIRGRGYGAVDVKGDRHGKLEPRLCHQILRAASGGRLQGVLGYGLRVSHVAFNARASSVGAIPVSYPDPVQRVGFFGDENVAALFSVDGTVLSIAPEVTSGAWVAEFDAGFPVGVDLRSHAGAEAVLELCGCISGRLAGKLVIMAVDPKSGETIELSRSAIASSARYPTLLFVPLKDWKDLIDESESIKIRVRITKPLMNKTVQNIGERFGLHFDRPRVTFDSIVLRFNMPPGK